MEEHKGQDVLSCTGAGVAAVGRAVFMQVCWLWEQVEKS